MTKRIVLTGGGSGGHIYPLLAVSEELTKESSDSISVYYIGPKNAGVFDEFKKNDIRSYPVISSKLRRYFSIQNVIDIPKFFISVFQMLWRMYSIMPDAVFSKGGSGALAVILAARFYFIPVIIHESDSVPGLTSRLSAKFAKRIGISFETAAEYFPKKKTAFTGNPVRNELLQAIPQKEAARENFGFNLKDPLIVILGGSQGAARINDFVFTNLKELLLKYQIFHQVGAANEFEAQSTVKFTLGGEDEDFKKRYKFIGFLDSSEMKNILSAADIIVSRSGSGAIYEISAFGKPSVLIPLPESAGNHQLVNAYEYEKSGGAVVIEETNFTLNIITRELDAILHNQERITLMGKRAKAFFKPDAAKILAREILRVALVS